MLLRGAELKESEDWIAQAAAHPKMPPSALHAEYILAGRRDATRRQRIIGAITAGVLLVSGTLGGLAFQQQRLRAAEGEIAKKDKERLTAASEAATAQANEATAKGRLAEAEAEKARQAEQQQAELKQEQSSLRQVAEGYRLIYRDPIQAAVHALRAMQDKPSADAERAMTDAWRVAVAQRANRMVTMTLKDIVGISFEKRERPGEVYSVIGRNGRHILLATERKGSAFSPQLPGEVYLLDSETLRTTRLQACGKGTGQPRLEYAGFSSAGDRVFVTRAFYVNVYNLEGRCVFDRTLQFQSTKSPVHIVGGFLAKRFLLGSDSQGRVWLLDTRGQTRGQTCGRPWAPHLRPLQPRRRAD